MSLRHPTVADLLFTFVIGTVCDVTQTSDCGISFKALSVISLRGPTVVFLLSPLCGVSKTPDCGMNFICLPFEASLQTPIGFQLFILFIKSCNIIVVIWASSFVHGTFMHSLIISFVRTVLRVLSKYSPGLLIWPDIDEGDLMDEDFDSKSDA